MKDIDNPRYAKWPRDSFCTDGYFHGGERQCRCGLKKKRRKVSPEVSNRMEIRIDEPDFSEREWGAKIEPGAEYEVCTGVTLKNALERPIWLGRITVAFARSKKETPA